MNKDRNVKYYSTDCRNNCLYDSHLEHTKFKVPKKSRYIYLHYVMSLFFYLGFEDYLFFTIVYFLNTALEKRNERQARPDRLAKGHTRDRSRAVTFF